MQCINLLVIEHPAIRFPLQGNPFRIFDFNDIDLSANHVTRMTPIYPAIDGRIILENAPEPEDTDSDDAAATIQFTVSLLLIIWIVRFFQ